MLSVRREIGLISAYPSGQDSASLKNVVPSSCETIGAISRTWSSVPHHQAGLVLSTVKPDVGSKIWQRPVTKRNGWGYAFGAEVAERGGYQEVVMIQGDGSACFDIAELYTYARHP